MKNYLKSDIDGKGFFKKYILFLIPILILSAISQRSDDVMPILSTLASLGDSYLTMLLSAAFFIYLVPFVLFKEKGFNFSGGLGEAALKFLKWYLLTVITLGIYSPWFIKNIANYFLERLEYEGKNGEFTGKPGTLLKYMLLTLYLPLIVLSIIFGVFVYRNYYDYSNPYWGQVAAPVFVFIVLMFLAMVPFIYFYISWLLNISFGGYKAKFNRTMSETAVFLIPQILLSVITVFIYYPAAATKIYRFIADGTVFTDEEGTEKGGFSFDGTAGTGFLLLWGQGLLSLITIGIYGSWAMAKVTNWFLGNTAVIEGES